MTSLSGYTVAPWRKSSVMLSGDSCMVDFTGCTLLCTFWRRPEAGFRPRSRCDRTWRQAACAAPSERGAGFATLDTHGSDAHRLDDRRRTHARHSAAAAGRPHADLVHAPGWTVPRGLSSPSRDLRHPHHHAHPGALRTRDADA